MMVDAFLPANLGTLTLSVTAAAIGARIPTGGVTGAFGSHSGGEYLAAAPSLRPTGRPGPLAPTTRLGHVPDSIPVPTRPGRHRMAHRGDRC